MVLFLALSVLSAEIGVAVSVGATGLLAKVVAWYSQARSPMEWRRAIAVLLAGHHLLRAALRHRELSRSQPFRRLQE